MPDQETGQSTKHEKVDGVPAWPYRDASADLSMTTRDRSRITGHLDLLRPIHDDLGRAVVELDLAGDAQGLAVV